MRLQVVIVQYPETQQQCSPPRKLAKMDGVKAFPILSLFLSIETKGSL